MAAITRWVQYGIDAVGVAGDGRSAGGKGTLGYSVGTASVGDSFTIGPTTNKLYINMDGAGSETITLYSGSGLDPRFVARDITEKMHALGKSDQRWDNAVCKWENAYSDVSGCYGNKFKIYSGTLGSSSSVTVASGVENANSVLGFSTKKETGGAATSNSFNGQISISGTYYGFFDEIYRIVITNDNHETRGIATPSKDGDNEYAGTMTAGGVYNGATDDTYSIDIDVTNGTVMGGGTGAVPTMSWTSTQSDDSDTDTELLYPNYWYNVGTNGLMVKFTDAVFNTCDNAWTVACYKPDFAQGSNTSAAVGTAEFVWASDRGDMSAAPETTAASGVYTSLGIRGLSISFTGGSNNLTAADEFYVICSAPKPSNYNITTLNFGNVTVSTESDLKCVMFEIESGAVEMSTVKFGLQSHGTFSHHVTGNADTYFRFGTVGPGNNSVGAGDATGIEWWTNVVADDIDSDTPPYYLYATEDNLSVVATADDSEAIGNCPIRGLNSDPMWANIRLGTSETGANSTINYRLYFDYS